MRKDKRNQNSAILGIITPKLFSHKKLFIAKRSNTIEKLVRIVDKIDVDREFKMMIKKALMQV